MSRLILHFYLFFSNLNVFLTNIKSTLWLLFTKNIRNVLFKLFVRILVMMLAFSIDRTLQLHKRYGILANFQNTCIEPASYRLDELRNKFEYIPNNTGNAPARCEYNRIVPSVSN